MPAPAIIHDLVERFRANLDTYRRGTYNETQVRREFIDPFFEALGWDMDNEQGYAEAYKDVVHEDAIKVGGGTKAPDYCFRIGGTRKFFVEAKKPSVDVKGDVAPGLPAPPLRLDRQAAAQHPHRLRGVRRLRLPRQARQDRQGRPRPASCTSPSTSTPTAGTRSPASSRARPSSRARSTSTPRRKGGKRGTAEVDDAFLAEIERWRDVLARNSPCATRSLGQRELNFAVQRTIDRIIFLRICEDRGIEPYGALLGLANGGERLPAAAAALPARRRALQLRPVPLRDGEGPRRSARRAHPGSEHRRQGAQRHPQEPLLPRQPLRVLRAAGRHPGPGLRAVPGQGDPPDRRATRPWSRRSRRSARRAASTTRPPTSWTTSSGRRWASCWRARRCARPRAGSPGCARRRPCASSTPPAAPARSCSAPTSTCSTGTCDWYVADEPGRSARPAATRGSTRRPAASGG